MSGRKVPRRDLRLGGQRAKVDLVIMVDFYLRDGNTVSGKLLSEDDTQVVVEQVVGSTIVPRDYSRKEIDTRTLKKRSVPESRYYVQMAEFFVSKTWDFADDPDEFIQAIRCYEKAKQSLQSGGAEAEKIAEIDKAIEKVHNDRDVWTREVESRAKLKKLEFDAEAENRLKKLESKVAESVTQVNSSIKYLDKTAEDMKKDYQRIETTIDGLNKEWGQQIRELQRRVQEDQTAINDIYGRLSFVGVPTPLPAQR